MDELDSITAETRSELSRGAKALDMLFELFPDATDPAPADGDEDDDEEAPDTFNSIKRARAKPLAQRADIDAGTPARRVPAELFTSLDAVKARADEFEAAP